jgi:hypothetical protein
MRSRMRKQAKSRVTTDTARIGRGTIQLPQQGVANAPAD